MRIRWWPHVLDANTASTRLRCLHVIEALRAAGSDVGIYSPRERPPEVIVLAKRYDAATVAHAKRLRSSAGTKVALDLCDNHFYSETVSAEWTARATALRYAVASADLVIASTRALEQVIAAECPRSPRIEIIGDAAEFPDGASQPRAAHPLAELELAALRWKMNRDAVQCGRRLIWFGNHGSPNADSGMLSLHTIRDQLQNVSRRWPASLTIVSNSRTKFRELARDWMLPLHYLPWRATTFSRALRLHDIAVLPIRVNPFSACKSNNRPVTALVHGLAVIADPIPSYLDLERFIYLGDWAASLEAALAGGTAVHERIAAGNRHIESELSMTVVSAQWLRVLTRLATALT